MSFNLDDYEPVSFRLAKYLETSAVNAPQVLTELIYDDGDRVIFKASLVEMRPEGRLVIAVGHAEERRGDGQVNRTSHVENAETSAIGRALANAGYAGFDPSKRASREEMGKVARSGGDAAPTGSDKATPAQLGKLTAMAKGLGMTSEGAKAEAEKLFGTRPATLGELSKREASKLIEHLIGLGENQEEPF